MNKGKEIEEEVLSVTLPEGGWQRVVTFPDHAGYTDDTLVMNATASFTAYHGQGKLYVDVPEGTEGFRLYVNHQAFDTSAMAPGGTYEVDFSDIALDGVNGMQVSNIYPAGATVTVYVPYPVVLEGSLAEAGMDEEMFSLIDEIISSDVEHGFSSAQLAVVKDGRLVYEKAWGLVNSYLPDGTRIEDGQETTTDTLFDLASNTKMYAGAYAMQYLVDQGLVTLDTRISDILGDRFYEDTVWVDYAGWDVPELSVIKEWKAGLTIRDIMCHRAGFPAVPSFERLLYDPAAFSGATLNANPFYAGSDGSEQTRRNTLDMFCKLPLMYEPGSRVLYSDADYMLLCFCIEEISGKGLQEFLQETFWEPMGLTRVTFNPLDHGFTTGDCAATELQGNTREGTEQFLGVRKATVQGQVQDERAYYLMGGVSGHAGLFASASDLARLASVMLTGGYGNARFFSKDVMDSFTAPQSGSTANWGVGWYREGNGRRAWYFSEGSSRNTIGHQGWTGTLTMIDPEENLVVAYLTNGVNTPITDKKYNTNRFDGNWYTANTLGFVPQFIYEGLAGRSERMGQEEILYLLSDMVQGKNRLVQEEVQGQAAAKAAALLTPDADHFPGSLREVDENHPVVRSMYSLLEVFLNRGEEVLATSKEPLAKAKDPLVISVCGEVQQVLSLLDTSRDASEIERICEAYPKVGEVYALMKEPEQEQEG